MCVKVADSMLRRRWHRLLLSPSTQCYIQLIQFVHSHLFPLFVFPFFNWRRRRRFVLMPLSPSSSFGGLFIYHLKWPFIFDCVRRYDYRNSQHQHQQQEVFVNKRNAATSTNFGLFLCFILVSVQPRQTQQTSYSSIITEQLSNKYFEVKPSDVQVIEGESAELKCQINANTDAGPVQWAKDGFLLGFQPIIPGYDRYTMSVNETTRTYNLRIVDAKLDDEGEFECQTSGTIGVTSSHTAATAKQPIRAAAKLQLIVSPKNILINSSRSYDGPDGISTHRSSSSPLFRSSTSSSSSSSTLSFANHSIASLSSGNNNSSSSSSSDGTFHSHSTASNTFIIEAHEAEKIIILCSVSHSKPPPRLKWYRKNIELLPEAAKTVISKTLLANRHTLFSMESSLVLYPKTDEEYRCQAEHPGLSKPLRAIAQINIYRKPGAPVIEGAKSGDAVNFREKINIKCTSSGGYPLPAVVWLRNGVEIDRSFAVSSVAGVGVGRHDVTNTLTFLAQQTDNMATFTCAVSNAVTPVPLQSSINLKVLLFPTQVRIIAPKEVLFIGTQGNPVTLECQAYPASPSPNESKIRWLLDGKEVELDESNYVQVVKKHDQQSWSVRSNLTFVVNSKEPNMRNIACIAYSSSGKSETVSATHQISVIYPPELPTLLGVKNGLATVVSGEIFRCKCVAYSGNPHANLVWLNHHNREISTLTATTGSGISSELVIRPSADDHGAVFRCHVLHPALEKPYEVSFTLHVLFPPKQLNITFPKFIKENDTIKIECTASPSNPCPTIKLLKDGKKIDEVDHHHHHSEESGKKISEHKAHRSWKNTQLNGHDDVDDDYDDDDNDDNKKKVGKNDFGRTSSATLDFPRHRSGQSVLREIKSTTIFKTDCTVLHNNNNVNVSMASITTGGARRKVTVTLVVDAQDDGSELTCLANSDLIPGKVMRTVRILAVHYKPRFNNYINSVHVNERENHHLSVTVRANPFVDNLVFSRVKETTTTMAPNVASVRHISDKSNSGVNNNNSSSNSGQPNRFASSSTSSSSIGGSGEPMTESVRNSLQDLLVDYENASWLLEPIPPHWSWSLSRDTISLNIQNASAHDAGLYVARVSNTLGDSLFFTRIFVTTLSSITALRVISALDDQNRNIASLQSVANPIIREGDEYMELECMVTANPAVAIRWTKRSVLHSIMQKSSWDQRTFGGGSGSNDDDSGGGAPNSDHNITANNENESDIKRIIFISENSDGADNNFSHRLDLDKIDLLRSNVSQSIVGSRGGSSASVYAEVVSRLTIRSVSFADAGIFTCVTPNDTRQVPVVVEHRPRIFVSPRRTGGISGALKVAATVSSFGSHPIAPASSSDFTFGDDPALSARSSVKFVCSALAYPISRFNWTVKDNQLVLSSEEDTATRAMTTTTEVARDAVGLRRVVPDNDKYQVISRRGIDPHHQRQQQQQSFASSTRKSEINSYYFTSELIIRDVSERDFGRYDCVAYNQMGTDRATFELVHKRFPETPSNLRVINVTHNSVTVTWDAGFDYGHEQNFQLTLWHIDKSKSITVGQLREFEQNIRRLDELPRRTFANLSVEMLAVPNLEADTYYRLAVSAINRLGASPGQTYLTVQTTSPRSYLQKPVYASADEQKLNGLIGNAIIGEEFLELSVILCLILLVIVVFTFSTFYYCRRKIRVQSSHTNNNNNKLDVSNNNNDDNGDNSNNNNGITTIDSSSQCKFRRILIDPLIESESSKFISDSIDYATSDVTQTPTVSSSLSNQHPNPTICLSSDISAATSDNNNHHNHSHHHHQQQQQQPPSNHHFSNSSYVIKDDHLLASAHSLSPAAYCCPISSSNFSDCKYVAPANEAKSKMYANFLAISPADLCGVDHPQSATASPALYPYELTASCGVKKSTLEENDTLTNFQILLSHQQLTNVHLLPSTTDGFAADSLCPSPLGAESFIGFPSLQYEPCHHHDNNNLSNRSGSSSSNNNNNNEVCSGIPLSTFDFTPQSFSPFDSTTSSSSLSRSLVNGGNTSETTGAVSYTSSVQNQTLSECISSSVAQQLNSSSKQLLQQQQQQQQLHQAIKRVNLVNLTSTITTTTATAGATTTAISSISLPLTTLNEEDEV